MKFSKFSINTSPHIGIHAAVSSDYGLFPKTITKDDEKLAESTLGINIIKISLGESHINGAIAKLYKNKVVIADSCSKHDVRDLEKEGLEVLKLSGYPAVGNLIAVNDTGLALSKEFSKAHVKEISEFFSLKANVIDVAETPLVGSCIALNNKSIAINPNVESREFTKIKKIFGVEGNLATVNYGDHYVQNGLLLNDKGVLIGSLTSGYEIIRLDDIFG